MKTITLNDNAVNALRNIATPENVEPAVNMLISNLGAFDKKTLDKVRGEYGHGFKEKAAYAVYCAWAECNGIAPFDFGVFTNTVYVWACMKQTDVQSNSVITSSKPYVTALPVMALLKKHGLV